MGIGSARKSAIALARLLVTVTAKMSGTELATLLGKTWVLWATESVRSMEKSRVMQSARWWATTLSVR
jgi:hypothetical protein